MKCFPNPLYIAQFRNANEFLLHVLCYDERACQLLKCSMTQEVKRVPFAASIIESSRKCFLTHFQKPMWFYLLATNDGLMGKAWGKTFLRCETPWTAISEIATDLSFKFFWLENNLNEWEHLSTSVICKPGWYVKQAALFYLLIVIKSSLVIYSAEK